MSTSSTTYSLSNQSVSSDSTSATSIKEEMSGWDTQVENVYHHHETIWNNEKASNLPVLTINNGGHMLFRTYDPEYLPPTKQALHKEKIVEKSFFFRFDSRMRKRTFDKTTSTGRLGNRQTPTCQPDRSAPRFYIVDTPR